MPYRHTVPVGDRADYRTPWLWITHCFSGSSFGWKGLIFGPMSAVSSTSTQEKGASMRLRTPRKRLTFAGEGAMATFAAADKTSCRRDHTGERPAAPQAQAHPRETRSGRQRLNSGL